MRHRPSWCCTAALSLAPTVGRSSFELRWNAPARYPVLPSMSSDSASVSVGVAAECELPFAPSEAQQRVQSLLQAPDTAQTGTRSRGAANEKRDRSSPADPYEAMSSSSSERSPKTTNRLPPPKLSGACKVCCRRWPPRRRRCTSKKASFRCSRLFTMVTWSLPLAMTTSRTGRRGKGEDPNCTCKEKGNQGGFCGSQTGSRSCQPESRSCRAKP